jgi:hypothetical protein
VKEAEAWQMTETATKIFFFYEGFVLFRHHIGDLGPNDPLIQSQKNTEKW